MLSCPFAVLLSVFLIHLASPPQGQPTTDLTDQYLSLSGTFSFVRRAPEGTVPEKVVLSVFEDFLCPHCYAVFSKLIPGLKQKYPNQLDIRFHAVPIVHASSHIPARAYAISHGLGLSEEMQHALFHARFEEDIDTGSRDGIAHVAYRIGLDPALLLSQLDADGGKAELEADVALGQRYHIESVPTLIIDGWIRVQDLSPQNLETIIEELLARK